MREIRVFCRSAPGWIGLLLAACAHPPQVAESPARQGDVSFRAQRPAAGQQRYQLALGETATRPTVLADPAPVYPPALVARALAPVDIHAQLAVDGEGRVYNVIVPGEAQADPDTRAFIAAVREAVAGWRFSPLVISRFAADAAGESHPVDSERPPFSQYFVFHFEVRDGRPVSRVGAAR